MSYQIKKITDYDIHPYLIARKLEAIADSAYKFGSPWHWEQFHDTLRRTDTTFLYVVEEVETEKWCGFILGSLVVDIYDIYMIAVLKEKQGQGLGTKLLKYLQEKALEISAKITLEVRVTNEPARFVYEKCDFQVIRKIKNYYQRPTEDALRMLWTPEFKSLGNESNENFSN